MLHLHKIICYNLDMFPILDRTKLTEILKQKQISSVSNLALISGLHRNTLYPLIRGEVSPFTETFLSLCKVLQVPPVSLIKNEEGDAFSFIDQSINSILNEKRNERAHYAFFLYGSRASDKARKFSDYDIGVTGGEATVPWRDFLLMKESLEQMCDDLSVKVSLLNFDEAPPAFLDDFDSPLKFIAGDFHSFSFFKGILHGRKKEKKAA